MSKSIKPLPKTYIDVPPTMLSDYIVPLATDDQVISQSTYLDVDEMEKFWLQHVVAACCSETQDDQTSINISWSAYFAGLQVSASKPLAIVTLLPILLPWLDMEWTSLLRSLLM